MHVHRYSGHITISLACVHNKALARACARVRCERGHGDKHTLRIARDRLVHVGRAGVTERLLPNHGSLDVHLTFFSVVCVNCACARALVNTHMPGL